MRERRLRLARDGEPRRRARIEVLDRRDARDGRSDCRRENLGFLSDEHLFMCDLGFPP
jgi:hypothetical protein